MFYSPRSTVTVLVFLVLTAVFSSAVYAERVLIPTPAGGGIGESMAKEDVALPFSDQPASNWFEQSEQNETRAWENLKNQLKDGIFDGIGGDDVIVESDYRIRNYDIDITKDGDIYIAFDQFNPSTGWEIRVYQSTDGGDSFIEWGKLSNTTYGDGWYSPSIVVAEGYENRIFVAYVRKSVVADDDIRMSYSELGGTHATFSAEVMVMAETGSNFLAPDMACDSETYSGYYLYVVASDNEFSGGDIHFARCVNRGSSFEASYEIGTLSSSDRYYNKPTVCYGFGGWVHVAWHFSPRTFGAFNQAIRYRRIPGSANGGLANWESIQYLTSSSNGLEEYQPQICAALASSEVVVGFRRSESHNGLPLEIQSSLNSGENFTISAIMPYGTGGIFDLIYQPSTEDFLLAACVSSPSFQRASRLDLGNWSDPRYFGDTTYYNGLTFKGGIAIDPSRNDELAMPWLYIGYDYEADVLVYFDAEWRDDPGYPNMEPGFPLGLWAPPLSPPAVVDVDGDSDLEIVFSDENHKIQVINPDGSSADGWPVDVGVALSDGPVAIGDLNGDGHPILVVGGTDGNAYAYDHEGNLMSGWPTAITAPGNSIYVSIGAVGAPYPRSVVCAGANYITIRNRRGVVPPGAFGWTVPGALYCAASPAIGDIDNDGIAEILAAFGQRVMAFEMGSPAIDFISTLPDPLSDAITLGDLDLDGDLEILCPTAEGILYVLDHTGTQVGGNFPFNSGTAAPLTSAAMAQCLGTHEPEITFANQEWTVHMLYSDGASTIGYPQQTTPGWYLFGAPIMGRIDGSSSDAVIGDRGSLAWSWSNTGTLVPGWPKEMFGKVNLSPAMGDIDQDGSNEIVFLTDTMLLVVDVNNSVNDASRTWAMYGHDPQRTGCSDCPEDMVTAVGPGQSGNSITRVSFAGPSPNPVSGTTQFSFDVPLHAAVKLEIIDLRGRRVYTVCREEMDAGSQVVTWNGQDEEGVRVASGLYFARLQVRGPKMNEVLTRKVVVIH